MRRHEPPQSISDHSKYVLRSFPSLSDSGWESVTWIVLLQVQQMNQLWLPAIIVLHLSLKCSYRPGCSEQHHTVAMKNKKVAIIAYLNMIIVYYFRMLRLHRVLLPPSGQIYKMDPKGES